MQNLINILKSLAFLSLICFNSLTLANDAALLESLKMLESQGIDLDGDLSNYIGDLENEVKQSGTNVKKNYFEVSGNLSTGRCNQYDDAYLINQCNNANALYSTYLDLMTNSNNKDAQRKAYETHKVSVNLVIKLTSNL